MKDIEKKYSFPTQDCWVTHVEGDTLLEAIENAGVFRVTQADTGEFKFTYALEYSYSTCSVTLKREHLVLLANELLAMAEESNTLQEIL